MDEDAFGFPADGAERFIVFVEAVEGDGFAIPSNGFDAVFAIFIGVDDVAGFESAIFEDGDIAGEEHLRHAVAVDNAAPALEVVAPIEDLFVVEIHVMGGGIASGNSGVDRDHADAGSAQFQVSLLGALAIQDVDHLIVDSGIAGTAAFVREPVVDAGVVDAETFCQPTVG